MNHEKNKYLKLGRATELPRTSRDFFLFRALEIFPGALAWVTMAGIFLASWLTPLWASFFIIAFDIYWLLKLLFLSIHLRVGFSRIQKNLKIDWLKKLNELSPVNYQLPSANWHDIWHLVIFPFYREPYEVIRDSLNAVAQDRYPNNRFIVVLAAEERAGAGAREVAQRLRKEFENIFSTILITVHPADISGELSGKGSNETWAIRQAQKQIIDPFGISYEHIMVSSFDIDTRVPQDYFLLLTYHYLTTARPLRSSYQPIPVFHNNIWHAPFFSRVVAISGTFWQMMQQARPERLATFSSHSMPFKALAEMKWWHTNVVSEDSRIFWQSLLFYDGDWRVVPLYYPVSMDANVGRTWRETVKNVYKQQRRWGWGVENVPYTYFGFLKNKKMAFSRKFYFALVQLEGYWSWSTNAIIMFLFGRLPTYLGGNEFNSLLLSYNLPRITGYLMLIAMFGVITSAFLSIFLLPPPPKHLGKRAYVGGLLQWIILPATIVIFGAIPGLDAQTRLMLGRYMGFWVTPKYRSNPETGSAERK